MEKQNFVSRLRVVLLALSVVFCSLSVPVRCQAAEVALLVQCTPSQGGKIAPTAGIHYFPIGSEVQLVAIPRPGYQFLYWLGDVGDAQSTKTIANLESAKIIIAVFRDISEDEIFGAGGMTVGRPQKSVGGGIRRGRERSASLPGPPTPPRPPRPTPIPEPSTVFLFGLAAVMFCRKQRP